MYNEYVKRVLLSGICLTSLFGSIASSMLLPIFPALFLNNTYGLIINDNINRELMYSLSIACFPLAMLVGTPIFGVISELFQHHKSKLIFYGIAFIMLSDIMSLTGILLHNVWFFLLSRFVCGFCVAEFPISMSLLNDLSINADERKSRIKLLTIAMVAGSVCGPLVTLCILKLNYNKFYVNTFSITFITAILFDFLSAGIFFYCAKISKKPQLIDTTKRKLTISALINSLLFMLKHPTAKVLVFIYLFYCFGTGLLIQGIPIFLARDFHYSSEMIGYYTTTMAIATIIGMYILEPLMARIIRDFKVILKINLFTITILLIIIYLFRMHSILEPTIILTERIYFVWAISILIYFMMSLSRVCFNEYFATSVETDMQSNAISTMSQCHNGLI